MSKEVDINKLKWIRIFDPTHIPKYLVEQVRDRDYTVEDFYKYQALNCVQSQDGEMKLNPFSHLNVLVNDENITKGFLWFTIDALTKDIAVQVFSVDKEYWGKGRAVKILDEYVKKIRKKGKLNKIYWVTNYPKHSMKYGYKKSKAILMEWDPKEEEENHGEDINGVNGTDRSSRSVVATTTRLSGRSSGSTATATSEPSVQPVSTTIQPRAVRGCIPEVGNRSVA